MNEYIITNLGVVIRHIILKEKVIKQVGLNICELPMKLSGDMWSF